MTSISVFAMNLVTALGLALAIDYSPVHRLPLSGGDRALGAGRARRCGERWGPPGGRCSFCSVTVAGATGSLMLFPQNFLNSMGVGGAFVALLSGLISLTVLPAVLVLLGRARERAGAGARCSGVASASRRS